MKKALVVLILTGFFCGPLFAGGGKALTVGATPVPHGELLNLVKEDLAARKINLKVVEYEDYETPNAALLEGKLDANFFQHIPYLESNEGWKEKLYYAFGIHIEPMGLYSSSVKNIEEIPEGALIGIPSDPSNRSRALLLLHFKGLLIMAPDAGLSLSEENIINNPKNLRFREMEAARLPGALEELDGAVINGNFAMAAGLVPVRDALVYEDVASPYVNVVVVRKGFENDERIKVLEEVLKSQKVYDFINSRYGGGVIPVFYP